MTKPLQERIGGGVGGGGGGRGGGDFAGFKGWGKSELGKKSKPGERGGAYFSFFRTVEPRYNESPRYNKRYFLPQLQYHVWKRTSI